MDKDQREVENERQTEELKKKKYFTSTALVNFFASHTIAVAIFPTQNDTLIKQITAPWEKDLQECDKAEGR